ncbi:MmgE/PrpD family protein [Amycolatopsis echigonensis]|uniref:MmgE/PrpD family protein n=1 Tax=Amycolatopsis echigonensis TaxID=2576905 RepID=A0A8E1VUJ6_9PSEU|nr:MmgE/PrpD family protein [Amycolatopsis echigonensis]MBB2498549.1 MmgE/PrpD family protein [Amycolatopsis echigonensis]
MNDDLMDELADFCVATTTERLPRDVVGKAKLCLTDFLSAALTPSAEARIALRALGNPGADLGALPLFWTAAPTAAYLTSIPAAATGRTDTHVESSSHPGMVLFPALLALAEQTQASGGRVLSAAVVGYEVMCRLGSAMITPDVAAVFRPTGVLGPVAAAAACAHLLALDEAGTRAALGMAANAACGLNHWARAATQEHVLHSAMAARTGVESALLAAAGLTASGGAVDGEAGFLAAFGARDRARLLAGRTPFAIRDIVHKPAPACIYVQGPCQLAEEIVRRHSPDPARVDSIVVELAEHAVRYPGCDNSGPIADVVAAQLSVQFSVASVLVAGGILDRNWRNPADAGTNRLAARTRLAADPELSARFPARNGSRVRVLLDDGRVLAAEQDSFPSMTADEIVRRFRRAADPVYGRAGSEAILASIDRLDRTSSATGLLHALQPR